MLKVRLLQRNSVWILHCVVVTAATAAFTSTPTNAQESAVVAVDDSPTAAQLLAQAQDQSINNPGESARLIARVLDELGPKLVRVAIGDDRFNDARTQAEAFLRTNAEVLARFRSQQSGEAQRLEASGDDARLVQTRFLTAAGLRGAIRLAQRAVDLAQFHSAWRILNEVKSHPDAASADDQLLLTLTALAAWGVGDAGALRESLVAAKDSPEQSLRDLGERLAAITGQPIGQRGAAISPLDTVGLGPLPEDLVRLWSEPLENSLYSRVKGSVEDGAIGSAGLEGALTSGRMLVSIPTICGSRILVNEGYVLRAYDAYSHQPLWYQFLGAPNAPRADSVAGELEIVVVAQQRVLALSGHALGAERSGGGRLVCMDLATGQKLWEFSPDRFREQPEFLGMFLYGAPTVVNDKVIVLGRKVTTRMETVSTVLGFDLQRGDLKWAAQVGAAPGIRMGGARPYTNPAVDGESVFVASGAGTLARIDADDGRIRWLRRDPVPIRDIANEMMPWEMGGACITRRGILNLNPSGTQVQLIDPVDGAEIDSMPTGAATAWGNPKYFLSEPGKQFVYGVGEGIVAFRLDDLRTPVWKFTGSPADGISPEDALLAASGRSGIRGRVQLGWLEKDRPALVVPMLTRAVVLNGDDGSIAQEIRCQGPANIIASSGILAAATNDTLDVYMGAQRAQRILVDAVRDEPADADAVVGLIEFALRANDAALLERATNTATPALEAVADDAQRRLRLVRLLVEAAKSGLLGGKASDALFVAVVGATRTPQERVAALLAQGDWFVGSNRPLEARDAWRAVLADPDASQCLIESADSAGSATLTQSGANAALTRLVALARAQAKGPAARQPSPTPPTGASAQELELFASRTPATSAAASAWLAAATQRFESQDQARGAGDAMAAIAAAINSADGSVVGPILDTVASLLQQKGLELCAAQALDQCIIAGYDMPLPSYQGALASAVLLASKGSPKVQNLPLPIAATGASDSPDDLSARLMRGVLAPVRMGNIGGLDCSRAYLVADRQLVCLQTPDLSAAWSIGLLGEMRFVTPMRGGVLVVEQPDRDTFDAQWIDDDGQPHWRIDDLAAAAGPANNAPGQSDCVIIPGEHDLLVVRADGAAGAFSLLDGQRVWALPASMDQISCADAGETLLAIGGTRSSHDEQRSMISMIDRRSGAAVAEFRVPNDEPVRWIHVVSPTEVAFATNRGVGRCEAIGAASGLRWLVTGSRPRTIVDGSLLGECLVVTESTGRTQLIDWSSGTSIVDRFVATAPMAADPARHWLRKGPLMIGWTTSDIDLYTLRGELVGSASLHGPRRCEGIMLASGAIVAVEQTDATMEPRDFGLNRTSARLLLHRFGWDDGGRIAGPSVQVDLADGRLDRIELLDGWLLLGGSQTTLAVPLP